MSRPTGEILELDQGSAHRQCRGSVGRPRAQPVAGHSSSSSLLQADRRSRRARSWASLAAARSGMHREALQVANWAVSYAREQGAMTTLPFSLQVQAAALIGEYLFQVAYASADEGWRIRPRHRSAVGGRLATSCVLVQIDALRGEQDLVQAHAAELQGLVARSGAVGDRPVRGTIAGAARPVPRPAGRGARAPPHGHHLDGGGRGPPTLPRRACPTPSRRLAPIVSTTFLPTPNGSGIGPRNPATRRASHCSLAAWA